MKLARNYIPSLQQGAKIIPADMAAAYGWGNTWYVSSVTGSDTNNNGTTQATPFATLGKAVSAATANNNDVIVLLPNHAESIVNATALNLNTAGIQIIGFGSGNDRPTITLSTANTATITVSAANINIQNVVFVANFLAIAALFTLTTAKDFQLINCPIRDTSAILNFIALVVTDTTSNDADGFTMQGCSYNGLATSGAVKLVSPLGTNDRWRIQNNFYTASTTNAGAVIPIATGKILTNLQLTGNLFDLTNASGTATGLLITTNGTTNTGVIDGNKEWSLATSPLLVTASSGFVYGLNYHADAADASVYLLPAADS